MNSEQLIEQIKRNIRSLGQRETASPVYREESIPPRDRTRPVAVPARVRQMYALALGGESYYCNDSRLFYRQAKFMEDYTDSFPYEGDDDFVYPTYQSLGVEKLRGYFTWRGRVRAGEYPDAPGSFIIIRAYELINRVGAGTAKEGFSALCGLWRRYGDKSPQIGKRLTRWAEDYAVFYGIPPGSVPPEIFGRERDDALGALLRYGSVPDGELYSAICRFSSYNPENSAFYKARPELVRRAVPRVWRAVADYFAKRRKRSFFEQLFGYRARSYYDMFSGAIFYADGDHPPCDYTVSDVKRYSCRQGVWTCEKYYIGAKKNQTVGEMLRAIDQGLRAATGFKATTKGGEALPKYLREIIEKEVALVAGEWREAERAAAAPRVELDLSRLGEIRAAADVTRDRLLTDEETDPPPADPAARQTEGTAPGEPVSQWGDYATVSEPAGFGWQAPVPGNPAGFSGQLPASGEIAPASGEPTNTGDPRGHHYGGTARGAAGSTPGSGAAYPGTAPGGAPTPGKIEDGAAPSPGKTTDEAATPNGTAPPPNGRGGEPAGRRDGYTVPFEPASFGGQPPAPGEQAPASGEPTNPGNPADQRGGYTAPGDPVSQWGDYIAAGGQPPASGEPTNPGNPADRRGDYATASGPAGFSGQLPASGKQANQGDPGGHHCGGTARGAAGSTPGSGAAYPGTAPGGAPTPGKIEDGAAPSPGKTTDEAATPGDPAGRRGDYAAAGGQANPSRATSSSGQATPGGPAPSPIGPSPGDASSPALDETTREFLGLLLSGGDYKRYLLSRGVTPDIAADRANEAFYGVLGDTAVGFEGEEPVIVEDYIALVKGAVER